MIAYKFLRAGRIGPFSGFRWPEPGAWVRAGADTDPCRRGIHACRTRDLPWWLADELWEIELDGEIQLDEHKIVAPAGRLRSRIDAWTTACAQEYADACAWRARDRAVEALTRAGRRHAADQLSECATFDQVLTAARRLAERDTGDSHQPHDRGRRRRPRAHRRASNERVHRGARRAATRRTRRLRRRAGVAVALARGAARPARNGTGALG